jgi:hypothetical protein
MRFGTSRAENRFNVLPLRVIQPQRQEGFEHQESPPNNRDLRGCKLQLHERCLGVLQVCLLLKMGAW